MAATERLSPPLSLTALGLKPSNNLNDAVRALLRSHEEIRDLPPAGGTPEADKGEAAMQLRQRRSARQAGTCSVDTPLPELNQLLVLVCQDAQREDILGGTFAVHSGQQCLADLGVKTDTQRLCLARYHEGGAGHGSFAGKLRSCAKDASRRCCSCCWFCRRRRCCAGCGRRLWTRISPTRQEWIQSNLQVLGFYVVCVRWGVRFLWEDRHMLLKELQEIIVYDLWAANDLPPLKSDQVSSELRPFCYALAAGLLYFTYRIVIYLVWAPGPEMDTML